VNCGVDIVEIERIKESIEKYKDTFLNKVFTEAEIKYCESHKVVKYQHYAARFAGKEAVAKLFGTGFDGSFDLKDIEIINEASGKPKVVLYNKAHKLFSDNYKNGIDISISHSKEYAISMVIGY
jgi:holo-[acyl-carrier protein] synthase